MFTVVNRSSFPCQVEFGCLSFPTMQFESLPTSADHGAAICHGRTRGNTSTLDVDPLSAEQSYVQAKTVNKEPSCSIAIPSESAASSTFAQIIMPATTSDRVLPLLDDRQCEHRDPEVNLLHVTSEILGNLALEEEFGINLGKLFAVCQAIHLSLRSSNQPVALDTLLEAKTHINKILALGVYMIMHLERDLQTTKRCLGPSLQSINQHDPSARTELRVEDYLGGIMRAKAIGWVHFGPDGFDAEEYAQLGSPLNGDLHEVVPGRLVLMQGPRDLPGGARWHDTPARAGGGGLARRDFSAAHCADTLAELGVRAVVRCGGPDYDGAGFEAAGIAVVDLRWAEGAAPPIDVVAKFLAVVERLPGAVAVHGGHGAGRGRPGALAALYMMKHHGFAAREAAGWLRIVRPGRCRPPPPPAQPPPPPNSSQPPHLPTPPNSQPPPPHLPAPPWLSQQGAPPHMRLA